MVLFGKKKTFKFVSSSCEKSDFLANFTGPKPILPFQAPVKQHRIQHLMSLPNLNGMELTLSYESLSHMMCNNKLC